MDQANPDVLLDVPQLSVDEITLEVDDLHARVSLQADVLELVERVGGAVERAGATAASAVEHLGEELPAGANGSR